MDQPRWMIYGAYGYTGSLIASQAREMLPPPVIAGRSAEKLRQMAARTGLSHRRFELGSVRRIKDHLKEVELVLNCAGPFAATALPMVRACLETGTHYLDITGEIEVFEQIYARHREAVDAGSVLCPGVGFDVIPTDCIAAALKAAMPDAVRLALAFDSKSRMSPGTSKTSVEGLGKGGRIRENGVIKRVPLAYKIREIDFGKNPKTAVSVPWGDISSSFYATGIPNIEVYMSASPTAIKKLQTMRRLRFLLGLGVVRSYWKRKITQTVQGPSAEERRRTSTRVWGEVADAAGRRLEARLITGNVYDVTVHGALGVVAKLLSAAVPPGAYSPSQLMGAAYVVSLPGSSDMRLSEPD